MLEFTSPSGKLYFPLKFKGKLKFTNGGNYIIKTALYIFFGQITGLENDLAQEKLKVLEVREREKENKEQIITYIYFL